MKENEILDQKKLESINGEMFQSFDPDDASRIIGGKVVVSDCCAVNSDGSMDIAYDITF